MLITWYVFVLTTLPAILAVGKKRPRAANGTDDGDDDSFPDGFFDIPDAQKSISDWNRLSLEVLKLKCMDAALSGMGSRVNLASRLFYHYHPLPILQSEDRPPFLNNSASLPSLSTENISNTPVHSNLQNTVNSQTETVSTSISIPRLRLRSTQARRLNPISTTSVSTSDIINWTSPASFFQAPSANSRPHDAISTDISAQIRNEVLSALSSPELINSISNQLSSRLPANLQQPFVDPPNINVARPSHPEFTGPENIDLRTSVQPVSSLPPISTAVMRRIRNVIDCS